jgi:hypothetical protein
MEDLVTIRKKLLILSSMDPFTHTHSIGRVESTQKKLCFVIPYDPMFFSQLKNDWPLDTNHENLYFSSNVTLRGKGLTLF